MDMQRGGSGDVRWKTVAQTSGCDRKRFVADSGQTSTVEHSDSRVVDEAERSCRLASVSAGRRSSSRRYCTLAPGHIDILIRQNCDLRGDALGGLQPVKSVSLSPVSI